MPNGMLVMHWDERTGVEVMGKYPEELEIKEKTLMQIYSQHEFSGEAGFVTLAAGAINLASYYTGPETGVYVILILSAEEDGDVYEEAMVEATRQILTDLDPEVLKTLLPPLFQRLSVYPSLNEEQKLSMIYNSDLKRMVIERIREEVVLGKSEIEIWLKDQYEEGFVDMESLIASLVKNKIIKTASVQGLTSDQVFLTRDLILLRVPPIKLVKDPEGRHLPASLVTDYMTEVRNFFDNYKVSKEDNIKIIDEVLLDPSIYETIKLLREAIVTRNDLEKLKKKGVDDVNRVLKVLWENKMIAVFKDESDTEYYSLVSDFAIRKVYPKYNLDTIREMYENRIKSPSALVQALDIMKDEYYAMLEAKKEEQKAEATK